MGDLILVAVILAFFAVAALLVRACGALTEGSNENEMERTDNQHDPGVTA